jgi:hypothetical protein
MDPHRFTGRAAVQTERFVRDVVEPIRQRHADVLAGEAELKV